MDQLPCEGFPSSISLPYSADSKNYHPCGPRAPFPLNQTRRRLELKKRPTNLPFGSPLPQWQRRDEIETGRQPKARYLCQAQRGGRLFVLGGTALKRGNSHVARVRGCAGQSREIFFETGKISAAPRTVTEWRPRNLLPIEVQVNIVVPNNGINHKRII